MFLVGDHFTLNVSGSKIHLSNNSLSISTEVLIIFDELNHFCNFFFFFVI